MTVVYGPETRLRNHPKVSKNGPSIESPAYLQLFRARGQCKTANSSCQMKVLAFAATADLAGGEWLSYGKVSQAPPRWMACTIGTRSQIYEGTFGVKEFWPDRRSLKKYIESSTFQILLETL
jgi:hypothetical protein